MQMVPTAHPAPTVNHGSLIALRGSVHSDGGVRVRRVTSTCDGTVDAITDAAGSLLAQAKTWIEKALPDPELAPSNVASALHISTRSLHRLFEKDGDTVGAWVRERRLERCRRDLGDPAFDALPVSHVGARWGLWDAAHFSRSFKSRYGVPPTLYRQEVAGGRRWTETFRHAA